MEGLSGHNCSQVAAAKDHTVVLTEDGCVYTFGLNIFHQLGLIPPPSSCNVPRQVNFSFLNIDVTIAIKPVWTKRQKVLIRATYFTYSQWCVFLQWCIFYFSQEELSIVQIKICLA